MTAQQHRDLWHDSYRGERTELHASFTSCSGTTFATHDFGRSETLADINFTGDHDFASGAEDLDLLLPFLNTATFDTDMSDLQAFTSLQGVPSVNHDAPPAADDAVCDGLQEHRQGQDDRIDNNNLDINTPADNIYVASSRDEGRDVVEGTTSPGRCSSAKRKSRSWTRGSEAFEKVTPQPHRQSKRLRCAAPLVLSGDGEILPPIEDSHEDAQRCPMSSIVISPFFDMLLALPLPSTVVHEMVPLKKVSSMARELKDQDQQRKYTNIVPIRPSTIAKPQDKFAHAIMLLNNKTREIKFYTVRGRDARGMLDEGFQVSFCRAVRKAYDISDPIGNNDKDPQHSESFHLDQLLFELLGFDFVPESGDRSYEVLDEYTREVLVDDEPDTQTDGPIHSSIHGLFKDIDTSQDMKHRLQPYRDASVLLDLIEKYLASSVESMNNTEELLRTMTLQLSQLDRELFPMAADQIEQALGQLRKGSDNMTKLECFVSRAKQRIQHVRQAKEAYTARLRSYLRELECIENI